MKKIIIGLFFLWGLVLSTAAGALAQQLPSQTFDYIVNLSWSGQSLKAIESYERLPADARIPDYVLPEIAKCYRISGQYEKAISIYQKILSSRPTDQDALRGLVYTFLDAGEPDRAYQLISQTIEKDLKEGEWLQLLLADCLLMENRVKEAESIYAKTLRDSPGNISAQLGICRVSIIQKDFAQAGAILNVILKNDPKNIEALFCKGALLESQREFFKAFQLYENILQIYPESRVAKNLKYRSLMDLGCNSLARDMLKNSGDAVDPEIYQMLLGNEAMVRLWWEEPDSALKEINRNLEYAKSAISTLPVEKNRFLARSYQDRLLALRQKEEMYDLEREAAMLKELNIGDAPWVRVSVADAKLYGRKPEEARQIYEELLARGWDPPQGNTRMAIYHADIEMGKYKAAEAVLAGLDRELAPQIIERGELRDNLRKEEVAIDRGWGLAYQDRLAEANRYAEDLLSRAPYNSGVRSLLAQIYLWRGWPRRSSQEFAV
ncbi:MAG: tetratricopeptide repeat protein, partial [Candidatus Omnitrophota bacterium]